LEGLILETDNINFTERMKRVISLAEKELDISNGNFLLPIHLLIACLVEKTGVLGEIYLKSDFDLDVLRKAAKEENQPVIQASDNPFFKVPISKEVEFVFQEALGYMHRYKQIYLNEGHLLIALITTNVIDDFLSETNRNIILTTGTLSRDLITHLQNYSFPDITSQLVRKVNKGDYNQLVQFVKIHFSKQWAQTIKEGFSLEEPTIYIAFGPEEEIVGFAAYDVFQNKKCYFGPMGVAKNNRIKGIGFSLLHHCLKDMKDIGYEYAIIGGAGPIEFYEKVCNAVVIPKP
jgi:N-acetylglutamate synthase-like GNAT family acetyltransferase